MGNICFREDPTAREESSMPDNYIPDSIPLIIDGKRNKARM